MGRLSRPERADGTIPRQSCFWRSARYPCPPAQARCCPAPPSLRRAFLCEVDRRRLSVSELLLFNFEGDFVN